MEPVELLNVSKSICSKFVRDCQSVRPVHKLIDVNQKHGFSMNILMMSIYFYELVILFLLYFIYIFIIFHFIFYHILLYDNVEIINIY